MDLAQLESKLQQIGVKGPITDSSSQTQQNQPILQKKLTQYPMTDVANYCEKVIPSWNNLQSPYEGRWQK